MKKGSSCYFCFVTVKSNLCETCKKLIITELNRRKKKKIRRSRYLIQAIVELAISYLPTINITAKKNQIFVWRFYEKLIFHAAESMYLSGKNSQ